MTSYLCRNALLKGLAASYLVAFMSLYMQIPGLYGAAGVLPAHVQSADSSAGVSALFWLRDQLGMNTQHTLELLALVGAALALLALLLELFRTSLVFAALLVTYGLLVQTGQLFLSHQWDALLLEAGVICCLLAPMFPWQREQPWDALALFLARWLLFRLTLSSGLQKLLSRCPTWWGLTALESLFESHWLPTPLAWYAHHLPAWILRLAVVAIFVAQIAVPFLFFAPVRRLRLFAFWVQVALQLSSMLTGGCGFYQPLILALSLSLVDDDWLRGKKTGAAAIPAAMQTVASFAVYGALLLVTVNLFELRLDTSGVAAHTAFSKADFEAFVGRALPAAIMLAGTSFLLAAAEALTSALMDSSGCCRALDAIWRTLVAVAVTAAVFAVSLVPLASLDAAAGRALPASLREAAAPLQDWGLLGQYGLYGLMDAGGRTEVVLEGADSVRGPWQEIGFRFKPGSTDSAPGIAGLHLPRLDYQFSVAADGTYHENPWLTSLAYRILTGQPEVIRLLDSKSYPFAKKAPKYVRGLKYKYKFTAWGEGNSRWWQRADDRGEYLPIYTADHKPLLDYLQQLRLIGVPENVTETSPLVGLLGTLRAFFDAWDPAKLLLALLLACWAVGTTRGTPWYS